MQEYGVVLAVKERNERPATKPMFSKTEVSYYSAWRAAIHCWLKEPENRPAMENVARALRPNPKLPNQLASAGRAANDSAEGSFAAASESPADYAHPEDDESEDQDESDSDPEEWCCYCKGPKSDATVQCHNETCDVEWVRLFLVNLSSLR